MIIIDDVIQGSPEWFAAKAGKPSSSNFSKIVTTKGEPSKSAKDYMYELAGQMITGKIEEGFKSFHMENGNEREEGSRVLFSAIHNMEVSQVGVIYKDELRNVLCSPDGVMLEHDTGLELKNPMMKTQVKYLLSNKLPTEYFCQVQGSMYVTGFNHYWFMSHYEGLPPLIIRVERDDAWIAKLDAEMQKFNANLAIVYRKLKEIVG